MSDHTKDVLAMFVIPIVVSFLFIVPVLLSYLNYREACRRRRHEEQVEVLKLQGQSKNRESS